MPPVARAARMSAMPVFRKGKRSSPLAPVDYDDWRARTRLVVTRVDPKALWERHVGGVVKVVEWLSECLRPELELGRCGDAGGRGKRNLGQSSPHPCRVLLLLLGSAGY